MMTALLLLTLTAQELPPWTIHRLPDTGQTRRYATARGDDSEFAIHPPKFERNADGSVTDLVTGLLWQQTDGGEMAWDTAVSYCQDLRIGGFSDWRLPSALELFTIQNHGFQNPALDTATAFTRTSAEYWWSGDKRIDDKTFAWATNAGGGIGAHRLNETRSAGGTKLYHVRCVRHSASGNGLPNVYTDNDDGTVADNRTGLIWQKSEAAAAVTWEEALQLAAAATEGWRVPNIKELRSLQSDLHMRPTIDPEAFPGTANAIFWSSTTQIGQQGVTAWTLDFSNGVVSYNAKTSKQHLRLVKGGTGPRIAFGGIRNAASGLSGDISAGEILAVHGSDLAGEVRINGLPVEIRKMQQDRAEVLTPSEIHGLETATIQVENSPPHVVRVAPAAPGIFTIDSGTAWTAEPPTRGSTVSIRVTGYGLADAMQPVEILLDSRACEITSVELAEPGILRVVFRVHADVATGKPLSLAIRIGDRSSQSGVTLEVQ